MVDAAITEDWLQASNKLMKVWTDQSYGWMRGLVRHQTPAHSLPPHFDDLIGVSGKWADLATASMELAREAARFQTLVGPSYYEIWQGYAIALQSGNQDTPTGFKQAMDDWLSYANKELVQLSNGDKYLSVQNSFTEALSKYRNCHRDVIDGVLERFDMPTQKEVEDLGRSIADIRKELRMLRKQINGTSLSASKKAE